MKQFALVSLCLFCWFLSPAQSIKITQTTHQSPWQHSTDFQWLRNRDTPNPTVVQVEQVFQEIDGFGGSFNELGWKALAVLPEGERQQVLQALFDPEEGCRFNICRMSIGANDFSDGYYSLNDVPFDYAMEHFSIDRDKQGVIPYIKMAMQFQPGLKVWGSPWTPPTWMKQNGHYGGKAINDNWGQIMGAPMDEIGPLNRIKAEKQVFTAYAAYFARYVEAYRAEGINLYAIHPQNEIFANQIFPSCVWNAEALTEFMAEYLIPRLGTLQPKVEVWLGTVNGDSLGFVKKVMNHPTLAEQVSGIGVQWKGLNMVDRLSEELSSYRIMQTESECNNGANDWITAEHTYSLLVKAFKGGTHSYMYWNMVLDELGFSNWVWRQNSMVSVNKFTKAVKFNPEFYVMKHFSRYIDPGARRIGLASAKPEDLAFRNPDGKIVLITANTSDEALVRTFTYGKKNLQTTVQPHSICTIEWEP